ncbi:MAG: hypothetical protein JWQ80_1910 [Massilia sp.]|nr:hypothetical protein [Massilia sp.]
MPDRLYRCAIFAGIAIPALLAFPMRDAFAQQIQSENIRGLDFGRFVAGSGGTVTLAADGRRTSTGGVILLDSASTGEAAFSVGHGRPNSVESGQAVIMLLPPNGSSRLASGPNSMAVGDFTRTSAELASIPAGGTTLSVGATLTVAPNQAPGNYSGTFSLIVNYQ